MNGESIDSVDVGWTEKVKTLVHQEWSWIQSGWSDLVKRVGSSYQRFAADKRA